MSRDVPIKTKYFSWFLETYFFFLLNKHKDLPYVYPIKVNNMFPETKKKLFVKYTQCFSEPSRHLPAQT